MKNILTIFLITFALVGCDATVDDSDIADKSIKSAVEQTEVKDTQPEKVSLNPQNTIVEDNKPDPTIGGKSRMEVLSECQVAIKAQLSNPRSFATKIREVIHKKYENGGEHLVGFKFYAKNQFNAESEHMGVCAFDSKGERLTAEYK